MAKSVTCAGCNKILSGGILGDYRFEWEGKYYCINCKHAKLPKKAGRECRECSYFYVDGHYNSYCGFYQHKKVDRNKKACDNFDTP